jgi:TetR/AcrR family transcriptional regulator
MDLPTVPPRRDRILAAAEREFAIHGSAGARMDRIAAGAGVNKQLLFHYFGSKAGLQRAVVESVAARLDLSASRGRTPAERLRELVALVLPAAAEYHALLPDEWRQGAAARAEKIIADGQRQGYFRDDVEPAALAKLIVAASLGWASVPVESGSGTGSERQSQFGRLVAAVISDYCTWR